MDSRAAIGTPREFRSIEEVRAEFYPNSVPLLDLAEDAILVWRQP